MMAISNASSDPVRGRVSNLKGIHYGHRFNHFRQDFQDVKISHVAVRSCILLLIPEANSHRLIAFWGDETDLVLKSLLFAKY